MRPLVAAGQSDGMLKCHTGLSCSSKRSFTDTGILRKIHVSGGRQRARPHGIHALRKKVIELTPAILQDVGGMPDACLVESDHSSASHLRLRQPFLDLRGVSSGSSGVLILVLTSTNSFHGSVQSVNWC